MGPAPTTATRWLWVWGKGSGSAVTFSKYQSEAKRFRALMATGSSSSPRRHLNSQGWLQIRPQIAGKGLRSRMVSTASSYSPAAIWATYLGMLMPTGQVCWQGDIIRLSQTAAGHFFSLMWASYSSRKYSMVESTGLGEVWPSPQSEHSLTVTAIASRVSMSASLPLPSVMRVRISSICLVPSRQEVHFPQDSAWVKLRK